MSEETKNDFVVSARKYRPKKFFEVVGQQETTDTLKNSIKNNQIAHSFLFCGPRGVGKTTIARIFSKTLNCKNLTDQIEACDNCDSCLALNNNSSFNINELDGASNNGVVDIRKLLEQTKYPAQNAKYKIFIIDEVHMLSKEAFNALLKTLEEPPSYVKFILATTEKNQILPTILSRCQIYDFRKISNIEIQNHLLKIANIEKIDVEPKALSIIAQKSDGGLRDSLSIFDKLVSLNHNSLTYSQVIKNLNVLDSDYYFEFIEKIYNQDTTHQLLFLDDILNKGFELSTFVIGFSDHIRRLWISTKPEAIQLLELDTEIIEKLKSQAKYYSESSFLNMLEIIQDTERSLKFSNNKRILVELMLLKLTYINMLVNTSWATLEKKKII